RLQPRGATTVEQMAAGIASNCCKVELSAVYTCNSYGVQLLFSIRVTESDSRAARSGTGVALVFVLCIDISRPLGRSTPGRTPDGAPPPPPRPPGPTRGVTRM